MFKTAFKPKEEQEYAGILIQNPDRKGQEDIKRFIFVTEGRRGAFKGKKLAYFKMKLDALKKTGTSGRKGLVGSSGNHVVTVFRDFAPVIYDALKAALSDKAYTAKGEDQIELEDAIFGCIYVEQCGFDYEVTIDGMKRKRSSVKVITLFDDQDKASDLIASAIDDARNTRIKSKDDDKKDEQALQDQTADEEALLAAEIAKEEAKAAGDDE